MTEAEVLAQVVSYADQVSANMQYWTSVPFAVLVAAHLTRGQVSGVILGQRNCIPYDSLLGGERPLAR